MRRAEETDGGLINWPDSSGLSAFGKVLNLSATATWRTKESGRCREVAVVGWFKQESMYGLSAKTSGRCREVTVVGWFKQESMYGLSAKKSGRCREVGDLWRGGCQWRFECITTLDRSTTLCSVQGLLLKYVMINAVFSVLTLPNLRHDVLSHPRVYFPSCSSPKLRFSCLVSELHQLH